ncbi:MAG TPA: hypothetical protein VFE76_16015 [Myxococcales bacterium]|nr:hypothetical protein [Myxococcales bacterium]
MIASARRSHDIDLFHDTEAALVATWASDRTELQAAGLRVEPVRELPAFVEARVGDASETVLVQWARDSAFRFFPLVEHDVFGLTLHPFDLATNKLLAVVGRREPRDWIDIVECHGKVQALGYLAWAAAGKDPGFSPPRIVEECARTRYVQSEIDSLDFDGPTPQAADVSSRWHAAVDDARELVRVLPADEVGKCVLDHHGWLQSASVAELAGELSAGRVAFHEGRIRGAFPEVRFPPTPR